MSERCNISPQFSMNFFSRCNISRTFGTGTPWGGRGEELAKKNDEQLTIFRRRNIGFIFQNYNLVPILNVYENIVLPVELDGDTVDQKFLDEIVHLLGAGR